MKKEPFLVVLDAVEEVMRHCSAELDDLQEKFYAGTFNEEDYLIHLQILNINKCRMFVKAVEDAGWTEEEYFEQLS